MSSLCYRPRRRRCFEPLSQVNRTGALPTTGALSAARGGIRPLLFRCLLAYVTVLPCLLAMNPLAADDWPHWRGPHRSGISGEVSGYSGEQWPAAKLWRAQVGRGASSPLLVGDSVYTLGWEDGRDIVRCLDAATGQTRWQTSYKAPLYGRHATGDQGLYAGPSSTPEYDPHTRRLYTLGADGELCCWDTASEGQQVWRLNLYDQYQAPRRERVNRSGRRDYGYTSSPLLHGDWLIVEVGAQAGTLIAFDKHTGRQVWTSAANDAAGHTGGPVPITIEGVPCAAVHTFEGLLVVRLDGLRAGETVATYPWKTDFANNIATPAVHGSSVVLTSAYNHYKIARLDITLTGIRKVWEQDHASKVCSPVIHDGRVYWAWRQMMCLDFETGKLLWKGGRYGDPGSCIVTADDRLIAWTARGDLYLVDTAKRSPEEYTELAAVPGLTGRTDAWPHVALAQGKLLCKDREGQLVCLGVK